jgi:ribose 5-phosphate isomerase B
MKIHLGTDHAGFELKEQLTPWLEAAGHELIDHGVYEYNPDDNYPDFILPVAQAVAADPDARGIILGGSGQGEAIAANRLRGVRAMVFYGPVLAKRAVDSTGRHSDDRYEIVRLSRLHNNANVFSIGARFVTLEEVQAALRVWLTTDYGNEPRYQMRIDEVDQFGQ